MDFGKSQQLSELRIVLMGYRAAGKSSSGNTILAREEFDLKTSAQCVRRHGEAADRHITVIEAPGWRRDYTVEFSPELLKQEIVRSVSLCPPGPHVILLIIRVDTRFNEKTRKAIQSHLDLLGERVWSHTIVLFTHGDSLPDSTIERHIESEGQELQSLLDKCGNRYHVLNNQNRSDDNQIKELLEKIEETVAQNNGGHFEKDRKILHEMREISAKLAKRKSKMMIADGERRCLSARAISGIESQLIMESRRNHSIELPPSMSSHKSSDTWSQRSSADRSFRPQIKAEHGFGSSNSVASTASSGYGSLSKLSDFVEDSEHKQKNHMFKSSELGEDNL